MVVRILSILTFVTLMGSLVIVMGDAIVAQNNVTTGDVGGKFVVRMTGDLAKEYAKRTGSIREGKADSGLQIDTIATIVQKTDDGQLGIEHTSKVHLDGKLAKLVTLTGTLRSKRLKTANLVNF